MCTSSAIKVCYLTTYDYVYAMMAGLNSSDTCTSDNFDICQYNKKNNPSHFESNTSKLRIIIVVASR